jgi:transposase
MDTPLSLRSQIIALHQHSSKSLREISHELQVPYSTVKDIVKKFRETGSVESERMGRCGRKRRLSTRMEQRIIHQVQRDPTIPVSEIMRTNPDIADTASMVTINRVLLKADFHSRCPQKKFLLSPAMKKHRLEWATDMKMKPDDFWSKVRKLFLKYTNCEFIEKKKFF